MPGRFLKALEKPWGTQLLEVERRPPKHLFRITYGTIGVPFRQILHIHCLIFAETFIGDKMSVFRLEKEDGTCFASADALGEVDALSMLSKIIGRKLSFVGYGEPLFRIRLDEKTAYSFDVFSSSAKIFLH